MGYNIREAAFYGFPILEAGNFTPSISHYEEQRSLNSGGERSTHFGLTPLLEAKPTVYISTEALTRNIAVPLSSHCSPYRIPIRGSVLRKACVAFSQSFTVNTFLYCCLDDQYIYGKLGPGDLKEVDRGQVRGTRFEVRRSLDLVRCFLNADSVLGVEVREFLSVDGATKEFLLVWGRERTPPLLIKLLNSDMILPLKYKYCDLLFKNVIFKSSLTMLSQ